MIVFVEGERDSSIPLLQNACICREEGEGCGGRRREGKGRGAHSSRSLVRVGYALRDVKAQRGS